MKVLPKLATENVWEFLPYTTIKEVMSQVWTSFWVWLVLSVISVVIGGVVEFLTGGLFSSESRMFPRWLSVAVVVSAILWFGRGEKVSFQMPKVGWKSWLFLTVLFTVWFAVAEYASWWVSLPFFWAVVMTLGCLDELAIQGRENYQKLQGNDTNAL